MNILAKQKQFGVSAHVKCYGYNKVEINVNDLTQNQNYAFKFLEVHSSWKGLIYHHISQNISRISVPSFPVLLKCDHVVRHLIHIAIQFRTSLVRSGKNITGIWNPLPQSCLTLVLIRHQNTVFYILNILWLIQFSLFPITDITFNLH